MSEHAGFRAIGWDEGFLVRKGAVMAEIRLGKGIQPTRVLGKQNFGLDL